jgi:hypothetical protein
MELTKTIQSWDGGVINSGNIQSFQKKFGDIANIEYTEAMLANEEKLLLKERKSTEVLSKLKPIIMERQKLFTKRYQMVLDCLKHGFENEKQRAELTIEFGNAYIEFKKVLAKLYFGLDEGAKQANAYINTYRR